MTKPNRSATIILRVLLIIMLASPAFSWSQTAITDAGQLAGFDDIHIGDLSYDVRFIDGSFLTIFGGSSGLDFDTEVKANLAATALLEAISAYPLYDSQPALTTGCNSLNACSIRTPFSHTGVGGRNRAFAASNYDTQPNAAELIVNIHYDYDTTHDRGRVYADWSQPTVIPVPAVIWLMGTGLLGLFGYSRRKVQ